MRFLNWYLGLWNLTKTINYCNVRCIFSRAPLWVWWRILTPSSKKNARSAIILPRPWCNSEYIYRSSEPVGLQNLNFRKIECLENLRIVNIYTWVKVRGNVRIPKIFILEYTCYAGIKSLYYKKIVSYKSLSQY